MSRRPSPSRSPVVTPFQRPITRSKPHAAVASRKCPWSFTNSLSDPHSGARMRSGQPSPLTSENTAPDIRPMLLKRSLLASSSTNRPPSLRNDRDDTAPGYAPGATRPPTNRSRTPSPYTSATASGPTLATSPGTTGVTPPPPPPPPPRPPHTTPRRGAGPRGAL